MKYKGKVALLFGGTSNMGQQIAVDLASFGAVVAVHYNSNEATAKEIVSKCNYIYKQAGLKQEAVSVKADAKDKDQIRDAVEFVFGKFDRLDFLVNMLTYPFKPDIWNEEDRDATEKGYVEAFIIDAMGTKHAMDAAMPFLTKAKGSIVNFSSTPVLSGYREGTAYSVPKAAVKQLTMDYALKYGEFGVRINAIAPGWVPKGTENQEELDRALEHTPLKQLGSPKKISQVVCDLLAWEHVTGQTIAVDGGEVIR